MTSNNGDRLVDDRQRFTVFVAQRQASLLRLTRALTGDTQLGEDLAQATLVRVWARWKKVSANGDPWPYTERVAVSLASTWRRRRWRGEIPTETPPHAQPATRSTSGSALGNATVGRWLATLPPRQRAVVVLRFLSDLSVDETARVLQCSPGTVKSQTAKARGLLRSIAESERESEEQLS